MAKKFTPEQIEANKLSLLPWPTLNKKVAQLSDENSLSSRLTISYLLVRLSEQVEAYRHDWDRQKRLESLEKYAPLIGSSVRELYNARKVVN